MSRQVKGDSMSRKRQWPT